VTLARSYESVGIAAESGVAFEPRSAGDETGEHGAPDADWAAACYVMAGDVYASAVGDADDAARCYGRALELLPGHGPALSALTELYELTGQLDQATALIERCLDSVESSRPAPGLAPEDQARLLDRAIRLYEQMGDLDRCLDAYRRLLALDPDGPGGLQLTWRLEATLAAMGRPAERAELLTSVAERLDEPLRRGAVLYDAARIYDRELDDPARAADLYREVLAIWPGDRYARAALISLLRRAGRWEELVAERRTEAVELADGPALARAMREAAGVLAEEMGRGR